MTALVTAAMMQALDQAKRDELIQQALRHLVTPQSNNVYGRKETSPLQDAFNSAVRQVAGEILGEMLVTDPIREQIRMLCADAFQKMATDRERLVELMANALVSAIRDR